MVEALKHLGIALIAGFFLWLLLKEALRPVRRLYYAGKSFFRGKYFHHHYVDEDGHLKIAYRSDFGLRFWTFMGKVYSFCVFVIPLFFLMVRLDGTNGYALAESNYSAGDVVMYYDVSELRSDIGTFVSKSNKLVIENDTGEETEISGFIIGKYYDEPLSIADAPGLLVRSIAANARVVIYFAIQTISN